MNYERKVTMAAHALMAGLLALLFLPTLAASQTGPVPSPPPACKPELVGGTGMFMTFGTSSEGTLFVRWACPGHAPGQWEIVGFSWDSNYIPKMPSAASLLRSGDLFDALWRENVVSNLPITQAHVEAEQRVREQVRAKLPAAPRWAVAPNGTAATRPVYAYTETINNDGTVQRSLGTTTLRVAIKADDGTPTLCDCAALRYAPASVTYCRVPAGALSPVSAVANVAAPASVCRMQ